MKTRLRFTKRIISPPRLNLPTTVDTEDFAKTRFKLAIQKNGELTDISLHIVRSLLFEDIKFSLSDENRTLFSFGKGVGFAFVRNKDICRLVVNGAVDAALVGLDQVYESKTLGSVEILREFPKLGQWDIVLATPIGSSFKNIHNLSVVATQYPVIVKTFFEHISFSKLKIIKTHGGTEVFPLLTFKGKKIDGVVDLRVSGKTLAANRLISWDPPLTSVYMVLIANKSALANPDKQSFFKKLLMKKDDC